MLTHAGVAELADAYGSGPYGGNSMEVQVLAPAPRMREAPGTSPGPLLVSAGERLVPAGYARAARSSRARAMAAIISSIIARGSSAHTMPEVAPVPSAPRMTVS